MEYKLAVFYYLITYMLHNEMINGSISDQSRKTVIRKYYHRIIHVIKQLILNLNFNT